MVNRSPVRQTVWVSDPGTFAVPHWRESFLPPNLSLAIFPT